MNASSRIPDVLKKYENDILSEWLKEQSTSLSREQSVMKNGETREQSAEFIRLLREASQNGGMETVSGKKWDEVRELLTTVSRSRGLQGLSPSETATFVFSFKKPFFARLKKELANNSDAFAEEM